MKIITIWRQISIPNTTIFSSKRVPSCKIHFAYFFVDVDAQYANFFITRTFYGSWLAVVLDVLPSIIPYFFKEAEVLLERAHHVCVALIRSCE